MSRSCAHHRDARCTNALALPLYGDQPSPGVCAICEHYDGPSRGLGDRVHIVARCTGIAAVARTVERVTGKPCGCAERRRRLNEAVPLGESSSAAKVDADREPI